MRYEHTTTIRRKMVPMMMVCSVVYILCISLIHCCYGFQNRRISLGGDRIIMPKGEDVITNMINHNIIRHHGFSSKTTTLLGATKKRQKTLATATKTTTTRSTKKYNNNVEKPQQQQRRRISSPQQGVSMSRHEMMQHDILTAEEEQALGRKIQREIQVKTDLINLCEEIHKEQVEQRKGRRETTTAAALFLNEMADELSPDADDIAFDYEYEEEEEEELGDDDEDLAGLSVYDGIEVAVAAARSEEEGYVEDYSFAPFDGPESVDISILSDSDVVKRLNIPGGKEEMTKILLEGAMARDTMISSNVRLVVSIAKKWCQKGSSNSVDANDQRLRTIYAGSWTRPSLDEAIQEGILGLSIAADRFDPERNFKFGTYATYWITNSVRKCFQSAATGCLRVPPHYHVLQQKYKKFVKECYLNHGTPPSMEEAAVELGITEGRLQFILRTTEPLISMDQPAPAGIIPSRGGSAGAMESDDNLILSNTVACSEPLPHERVDMSLLRQCLENAMAAELSPHERDVLRLRHGLDDGVARSAREVVELCGGTLSVSDIRSAELRAFRKLRSSYSENAISLLSFLDHVGVDASTVKMDRRLSRRA